jgi:2-dehydro-3-deoxygalactonokinase
MTASDRFISCDWGTSSFRLYLVRATDGSILHALTEGLGVKPLHEKWRQETDHSRQTYFVQYLHKQIDLLSRQSGQDLGQLPVYISGMASSSIGMMELPYAKLPFALSGRDLQVQEIAGEATAPGKRIILLSGLKSANDVMRGEESQMIGLADHLTATHGVAILPGTHSKHIHFLNGEITDFHTYMTGEFFAILCEHSILRHSLKDEKAAIDPAWFENGIRSAEQYHVLNAAFHVRTNELLHGVSPKQNRSYLSGLLIGSELRALPKDHPVFLCGGGHLLPLYRQALEVLGNEQVAGLPAATVDQAVVKAHLKLYGS